MADIDMVEEVLAVVEREQIPAPAPIEHRWTAPSTSRMSVASEPEGGSSGLHAWVGIIMYMGDKPAARRAVTEGFAAYRVAVDEAVYRRFGAEAHWAKVEAPADPEAAQAQRDRLAARFPIAELNVLRRRLDPQGILSTEQVDSVLGSAYRDT